MFTLCEMTARNVILERWVEDEKEEKKFPAWKEVWDFCFEKKNKRDGTEADGQGDGPWVTSVTRMKVISLFFDANWKEVAPWEG